MAGKEPNQPFALVVLAKDADAKVMQYTIDTLSRLQIETEIVDLHDTGLDLLAYIQSARSRGLGFVVFGTHYAYADEHCPTVAEASVPIVKVVTGPVPETSAQITLGIASMGFGVDGAINAGLFAAKVLALADPALAARLTSFQHHQ